MNCVITGLGVVCPVAGDKQELADALRKGRDGIGPIRHFDTSAFSVHTGAEVADAFRPGGNASSSHDQTAAWAACLAFAERAILEAIDQAALDAVPRSRIGLAFGTNLTFPDRDLHELAETLARRFALAGPVFTISTACSSSTVALGLAKDLLEGGATDVVVAGGADVLTPEVFAGFHALGVLAPEKCAPFSEPFGTTLGEGAGFFVLESAGHANQRGVAPLASLSGYGLSGDGYHETSPDPRGGGVRRAVCAALADAGIDTHDIGYVNAHGSGTAANDPAEWRGISAALGGHRQVPISSSKGAVGHALGAAGAIEAAVTIVSMRNDQIAPTLHFSRPRRFAPPDPVPGPRPRSGRYDHALSLSSAFGGSNAALVLSRRPTPRSGTRPRRPVFALGVGVVGPFGFGVDALPHGLGRVAGNVPDFALRDFLPRADPRGLDPASRFLATSAALALRDAGVRGRGAVVERIGLFGATVRPSSESRVAFRRSLEELGLLNVSVGAFARIVLNASAGFCTKLLSLRGPLTVVSAGSGSGLLATVLAAQHLSGRGDVDTLLAGGVDERLEEDSGPQPDAEGAACLLVGTAPVQGADPHPVRVSGWGLAGPGRVTEAVDRALRSSGRTDPVDVLLDESRFTAGPAAAMPSALACAVALQTLRSGRAERVLVTSSAGASLSAALVMEC